MILGVDEVGRGCWAGPLVAGAVLFDDATTIPGLKDSKKLTKLQREKLDADIRVAAVAFGLGWVAPAEIDRLGLTEAVRLAMRRALDGISADYDRLIVDGNYNYCKEDPKASALVGADNLVPAVSAASVIAKVARDHFMAEQARTYPAYGFERHVGYGTRAHVAALQQNGLCALHRRCFKPIQAYSA
ncbi:MAG TPA: ribonuclease HII [Candidatus Saccharimonadales bacterium]|nr:ribonuclease HII [Candidatus Saccharimonadales bacterium]